MAEAKKCGFKAFFKNAWEKFKGIQWCKTVNPIVGYSAFGGVVAFAVLIGVLVICLS